MEEEEDIFVWERRFSLGFDVRFRMVEGGKNSPFFIIFST